MCSRRRLNFTLQNNEAVYERAAAYTPGPHAPIILHGLMGCLFAPTVTYAKGAKEEINGLTAAQKAVVLASNHLRNVDSGIIAALCVRERTFRPLIGTTIIPAKASLFKQPVLGKCWEVLGGIPVFRTKEVDAGDEALAKAARQTFLETCIGKMDQGANMAIYVEGGANKQDPAHIQRLQRGIGDIVCGVTGVEQPHIIPVAIHHGRFAKLGQTASLYIGRPSSGPFESSEHVLAWLGPQLQDCVDANIRLAAQ